MGPSEDARANAARQSLEALGITQPQLVVTIFSKHLDQVFKFTYQIILDQNRQGEAHEEPQGITPEKLFRKICGLR